MTVATGAQLPLFNQRQLESLSHCRR